MCKAVLDKPSKSPEYTKYMTLPHSFKPSDEVMAHIKANAGKAKDRTSVMCQNCGSVMIIGNERLARFREIGVAYCDNHCAGQDRSRVYRNSPEVFDKHCDTRGTQRRYLHSKITARKCSQCEKPFVSRDTSAIVCSKECQALHDNANLETARAKASLQAFIDNRSKQRPVETKCRRCDVSFTALTRTKQSHHYCSALCRRAIAGRKRKAKDGRKHRKRERVKLPSWAVRGDVSLASLHARSKGKCAECKCKTVMCKTYQPDQATADHIVPMSKGGLHIEDNLQLMCQKCNGAKSNAITGDAQMVMF